MTSAEAVYLQEVKWVLPFLVLAGCWSDEPGLHLKVQPNGTGATRVELYLATRACADCGGTLKPKGAPGPLDGEIWLLDGNGATKTPNTVAEVKSGSAAFDLLPPGTSSVPVAYVVAVGYDAADKLVGVAKISGVTIPVDSAEFIKVGLDPAQGITSSDRPTPEGNRVWVWRRPDAAEATLAACVGLEVSDGKKVNKRLWFVPEDDTDCDSVKANECNEFNFQSAGNASIDQANCTTLSMTDPEIGPGICLVGGPACVDGIGDIPCGPVKPLACIPLALCTNTQCRQDLPACIGGTIANNVPSFQKVTMPSDSEGNRCSNNTELTTVKLDLAPFLGALPGLKASCDAIRFVRVDNGQFPLSDDFQPAGGALFQAGTLTPGKVCEFDLTWISGRPSLSTVYTLIAMHLDNERYVMLPLKLEIIPNPCDGTVIPTTTRFIAPTENMGACAR